LVLSMNFAGRSKDAECSHWSKKGLLDMHCAFGGCLCRSYWDWIIIRGIGPRQMALLPFLHGLFSKNIGCT
jgi:hypothetical protein